MRNIELKCRCGDLEAARARAESMGARDAGILLQEDRFFPAAAGRLKLRLEEGRAELIGYRRTDEPEPRASDYLLYAVEESEALTAVLAHVLGKGAVVRKRRHLFLLEHTRIHLDEVEGLGCFVELETVLSGQAESDARAELERIAAALGLKSEDRIATAYVDLLTTPSPGCPAR